MTTFVKDPYDWWKSQADLTVIRTLGMRLSCLHSSSANTERFFSGLSRIITPSRSRLSIDTIFELMVVITFRRSQQRSPRARSASSQAAQETSPSVDLIEEEIDRELNTLDEPLLEEALNSGGTFAPDNESRKYFESNIDFSREGIAVQNAAPPSPGDRDSFNRASDLMRKFDDISDE